MNAPIDPSISSLLRGSSLAPMMDQPVSHILHGMGLPQLPQLPPMPPLPGLPPLPQIDLTAIVRPLTDMASAFGTGQFGGGATHPAVGVAPSIPPATSNAPAVSHAPAASNSPANPQSKPATPNAPAATNNSPQPNKPGAPAGSNAPGSGQASHPNTPDPTQVLQAISTGLQTVLQLGSTALPLLMQLWQGQGSQQAAATGAKAASSGTELATQSGSQKAILGAGAGSVALGGAQMAAVMGKYLTTAAITAPFLVVPGGQAFLLEATAEAIAEGLGVTANTRAQMAVHSVNMTAAGKKVKVTAAPTGVKSVSSLADAASSSGSSSSGSSLQQLMQLLSPASSLLSTGMQSAQQLASVGQSLNPSAAAKSINDSAALGDYKSESGGSSLGGGGFGLGGGGGAVAAVPATPLSPWAGTAPAGTATPASTAGTGVAAEPVEASSVGGSSPMMPMGGGAAAMGATKSTTASAIGDAAGHNLVTSNNGDAVVGPMEGVTMPVVGALASPQTVEAPPDKELTL
ncbi:hypothetical protein ABIA39_004396 [Nocardia sp. GAS34]|uniref:hypothetical protein n=1 Tax=unclassified Nocardia TaxID=2637762 RepID=UPI003D2074AD